MATDELEEMVKRAAALADRVQEKYQLKAFELLLQSFLAGGQQEFPKAGGGEMKAEEILAKKEFKMPIALRALFSQYSVPEESIHKLFLVEGDEVVSKFSLKTVKKARAQIELALMVALENALKGGKFEFDVETVRKRCQEQKAYDAPNFLPNFKQKKNLRLFKSLDDPEHVELSPDGKAELAQTVAELAK